MLNANLKQQQVDNKKATTINYQRKLQANPMQYTNINTRNNIFSSENNYYLPKEYYTTIDVSSNATQQQTNANTNNHTNATASINIGNAGLIDTNTTNNSHILNDQLSVLFPKCRPKNDANLNKTASIYVDSNGVPTSLASASQLLASSPTNGDYKNQNQLIDELDVGATEPQLQMDNNRPFMRVMNANQNATDEKMAMTDDRKHQMNASGVDDVPMRMNHANYRTSNANSNYQRNSMTFPQQAFSSQQNDFHGMGNFDIINQSTARPAAPQPKIETKRTDIDLDFLRDIPMWEKRKRSPSITPANNVLNSPDFNESHMYSHHPVQHQIKLGRSPVNQHDHNNKEKSVSPVSPVQPPPIRVNRGRTAALTVDGDFIFEDIDLKWRKPIIERPVQNRQQMHTTSMKPTQRFNHMLFDDDDDDIDYEDARDQQLNAMQNPAINTENVTKMIGEFEIATNISQFSLFVRCFFVL